MNKIKIKIQLSTLLLMISGLGFTAIASNFVSIIDTKNSGGIQVQGDQGPLGTIMLWGNNSIPSGWIELKGQSTAGYPELASSYGDSFPDLRGVFVRGWDNGRGLDSGRDLLSFQSDENKSHEHTIQDINSVDLGTKTTNSSGAHTHTFARARGDENYINGSGSNWWGSSSNLTVTTTSSGTHTHTLALGSHGHTGKTNTKGTDFRPKNTSLIYIIKVQ